MSYFDDGKMDMTLEGLDSHRVEVMRLAERYGFISYSYCGTAVLFTNSSYLDARGPKELANRLRVNNVSW